MIGRGYKWLILGLLLAALIYVFYPLFMYGLPAGALAKAGIKDVLKKDHLIYAESNYIQIFITRLFILLAAAAIIKTCLLYRNKIDTKRIIKKYKLASGLINNLKEKIIPMSEIQRKNLEKK